MVAEIYGVHKNMIRARAKRENWRHDLAAQARARVRAALAADPYGEKIEAPAAPIKLTRNELLDLQREDIADCTERWRSWANSAYTVTLTTMSA